MPSWAVVWQVSGEVQLPLLVQTQVQMWNMASHVGVPVPTAGQSVAVEHGLLQ